MKYIRLLWQRLTSLRPALCPRPAFAGYMLLGFAALVFTQLLRSPASALLYWFFWSLPVCSVLYLLIARLALKVVVDTERTTAEKMTELTYELKIINEFIFPFSHVEAVLSMPESSGVRCSETRLALSVVPMSSCSLGEKIVFPYRGTYEIGVKELVVSDFLGLFTLRIDVDILTNVLVLPRRLRMEQDSITSATDVPTDTARVVRGTERSEIGDIRAYQSGDSLKSIHWKLSSKTQDLQVKQYDTNTARSVYVLCDFSRAREVVHEEITLERKSSRRRRADRRVRLHSRKSLQALLAAWREKQEQSRFRRRRQHGMSRTKAEDVAGIDALIRETAESSAPAEQSSEIAAPAEESAAARGAITDSPVREEFAADMDEYCTDGVVEMTLAAVENELRCGNICTLLWFDVREESGVGRALLTSVEDLNAVFRRFATAPICSEEQNVTRLTLLVEESQNVTFRIATAHIDAVSLTEYAAVPSMFGGAGTGCVTEILLFNPEARYADSAARREYVEMCREQLAQDGIYLTAPRMLPAADKAE